MQVSGAKSSRARESDKGEQDIFYSSDSELGTGAIKVGGLALVIRAVLVTLLTLILDALEDWDGCSTIHHPMYGSPVDIIKLMHNNQMLRI